MHKLHGKVAIVTGAARGLGAAIARRLVAEGAKVVLTDVLDEAGRQVASELGENAFYVHLDVRQEQEWGQAVNATIKQFGRIDIFVSNAGVVRFGAVAQMTPEEFRFVTEVNYIGPFLGMRAIIPKMMEIGGGSIINMASINGLVGAPGTAAYTGSKHGLVGMTKSVAMELGTTGIRVNAVCPGVVDTQMIAETSAALGFDAPATLAPKIPMKRLATADEMTGIVVFLASDDSSYCTGGMFTVDGGWTAGC